MECKDKMRECDICGKKMSHIYNLRKHMVDVHKDYRYHKYKCACGTAFISYPASQAHAVKCGLGETVNYIVQRDLPGECDVCGKAFVRKSSIQQHKRNSCSGAAENKSETRSRETVTKLIDELMELRGRKEGLDYRIDVIMEELRGTSNEVLVTETHMFEKYLKRVEPKDLVGVAGGGTGATPNQSSQDLVRRVDRKRSKSRSSNIDKSLRLNAEQKCDIAQRELEELREEIDKLKEDSEKVLDTYKAIMEEADLRLAETKKESYEFDRDIMKGAVNQRTSKVVAEKVVRYFEDRIKSRDTLVEKLRLKNSTLKVQKKKLHLQLKQKEEMGEVLHEVDFNQLKIENQQYLEKIDERNQDLLRLKLMAGNTLQVLNSYKKKLHTLTMESERLKSEITSRNDLQTRIDGETQVVEMERAKAEKINRKLRQQLADFRVPDVMEYVSEKSDLYELQKKVKSWERKVEIADMALRTHRKTWQQMKISHQMANQWQLMEAGV